MTVDPTPPWSNSSARGSRRKGIAFGLLTLLGGYALMWPVLPSVQPTPVFVTFLFAPWAVLIALFAHFLQRNQTRTALGLGIAAVIVIGIVLLLFGLLLWMFARGGHH